MDADSVSGVTITHSYLVLLSTIGDGDEVAAYTALVGVPEAGDVAAVPALGSTYAGLVCSRKSVRRVKGRVMQVVCTYSPYTPNFEPIPEGADSTTRWNKKLSRRAVISVEGTNRDWEDKPIQNTANDTVAAAVPRTYIDTEFTIQFSCITLFPAVIDAVEGTLNSDTVTLTINGVTMTFAPLTLKLTSTSFDTVSASDGRQVFEVTVVLTRRKQIGNAGTEIGWTRRIENTGYRYKDDSGNWQRSPTPVYLTSDGHKLADGASVIMIEKRMEKTAAFMPFLAGV